VARLIGLADAHLREERLRVHRRAARVVGPAHLLRRAGQDAEQQRQREREHAKATIDFDQRVTALARARVIDAPRRA
jgi:hypothetical protein